MPPRRPSCLRAFARRQRWAWAWLLGAGLLAPSLGASAAGLELGAAFGPRACTHLSVAADEATCTAAACVLDGQAQLRCDNDLRLFADHLEVAFGPERTFAGAQAQGHVMLVDGAVVLRAEALVIDADQIRGRLEHATLEVRRPDASVAHPDTGLRNGRNALIVHGSLERLGPARLRLTHADLTLCDCGPNCLPSWRFDAPRIDVALEERALIMWPQLRINLGGRWLVPITPPLLPLSLPLRSRAPGFLPPQISFLQLPYPTVDAPFFLPLGPSWDITVAPGIRTDWGAPRLSARLRYAPSPHTTGRLRASLTHDYRRAMAQQHFAAQVGAQPQLRFDPAFLAEDQALRRLTERVSVDWEHATHTPFGALELDALADVTWISDDLVNRDLLISPEQRVAAYLPSRGAVLLRHKAGVLALTADGMLRLDNPPAPGADGLVARDYSNVHGAEAATLHRLPALHLTVLPQILGPGLSADGQLSYMRYGRLGLRPAQGAQDVAQTLWGGAAGLNFGRQLGPVNVHARAGVDSIYVASEAAAPFWDTAPLTQAHIDVRLARRFGPLVHVVQPRLAYRGLSRTYGAEGPVATAASDALDERLLRRGSQQALFVVQQSLWRAHSFAKPGALPALDLEMGQPLDLRDGGLLQPFCQARVDAGPFGQGAVRISLDPRRWATHPVRELVAQYGAGYGPVRLSFDYSRMAPDADRFQRSIYELAAPIGVLEPQSRSDWAHLLRATLEARIGRTLSVHYTTLYQLPQPEQSVSSGPGPCAAIGASQGPSHCFVTHLVRLGYSSPCDCWGIESVLSGAPQDLWNTLRFQILLNVAGASFGQSAAARL